MGTMMQRQSYPQWTINGGKERSNEQYVYKEIGFLNLIICINMGKS